MLSEESIQHYFRHYCYNSYVSLNNVSNDNDYIQTSNGLVLRGTVKCRALLQHLINRDTIIKSVDITFRLDAKVTHFKDSEWDERREKWKPLSELYLENLADNFVLPFNYKF